MTYTLGDCRAGEEKHSQEADSVGINEKRDQSMPENSLVMQAERESERARAYHGAKGNQANQGIWREQAQTDNQRIFQRI